MSSKNNLTNTLKFRNELCKEVESHFNYGGNSVIVPLDDYLLIDLKTKNQVKSNTKIKDLNDSHKKYLKECLSYIVNYYEYRGYRVYVDRYTISIVKDVDLTEMIGYNGSVADKIYN